MVEKILKITYNMRNKEGVQLSEQNDVKYYAIDVIVDRFDRINRRLIAVIILLVVLLVGSNIAWVVYENQFDDLKIEVEQEAEEGTNNFANDGSFIYNGE